MAKVLGFSIQIQGTEKAITTSEELRRAIADIQKELRKAGDVETIKKLESELVDLEARQNEVNKEIRETVKARQEELTGVKKTTSAYDSLSKELNETRKAYKDLAAAGKENSVEAQNLLRRTIQLDTQLKNIDASVGQFQRNLLTTNLKQPCRNGKHFSVHAELCCGFCCYASPVSSPFHN